MEIAVIGRGNVGGGLARRWRKAGHEVTELGRGGGDASGAEVVLLAVPSAEIENALRAVDGIAGKTASLRRSSRSRTRSSRSSAVGSRRRST